jgi:hypothetical protein
MKNRKFVVVAFVVVAAMLMGVGYAALTDTLTVIGNANVDIAGANSVFDERIYFSDAQVVKGVEGKDGVTFTADDATYNVHGLATIADEAVFLFTIKNDSNLDAEISVADKKLSGAENPSNSNPTAFTVAYDYPEGTQIEKNGGTVTVKVTVKLAKPIDVATSATFGLEIIATSIGE